MNTKALIEGITLDICLKEKTAWDTSFAFVTRKVAFSMREVLEQCRKNYWGVFDKPIDPVTGREKLWEHLTKVFVDFVVKNIDLDTKDINFKAKTEDAVYLTDAIRSIYRCKLDEIDFGEDLDIALRQLAIDGTIVWANDDELKPRLVNLLNFGIDPTAFSIAEAHAVQERMLPTVSQFKKMARQKKWLNYEDVSGSKSLSNNDPQTSNTASNVTRVELFRRRGMLPETCFTGDLKDFDKEVPAEVWFSSEGNGLRLHAIERRKDNAKKGYEEAWFTRVWGRWYGEGVAERLIHKQIAENENVNIRMTRARVGQLGIFLIRNGSGIRPEQLSRLAANGALLVNDVNNDIKQMPVDEASESSYRDSEINYQWAQRLTSAFESSSGEGLPSSMPATNAVIQQNAGNAQFTLTREQFGMFLSRWVKSVWPIISKTLKVGDVVRVTDEDTVSKLDKNQIYSQAAEQLAMIEQMGGFVDPQQVMMEIERAKAQLQEMEKLRFITLLDIPDVFKYDVTVYVSNEKFDKAVLSQNLLTELQVAPEYKDQILKELHDLQGLSPLKKPDMPMMATPPAGVNTQSGQEVQTQMNTFEGFGKAQAGAAAGGPYG